MKLRNKGDHVIYEYYECFSNTNAYIIVNSIILFFKLLFFITINKKQAVLKYFLRTKDIKFNFKTITFDS